MLKRFVKLRADVDGFFAYIAKPAGMEEFSDCPLADSVGAEEWFYVQCLCCLLEPFTAVTTRLSGEKYPTFTRAFPYLRMIKDYLKETKMFDDVFAAVANESFFVVRVREEMHKLREALLKVFMLRFKKMDETHLWVPSLEPRLAHRDYLEPHEMVRAEDYLVEVMVEIASLPSEPLAVQVNRPLFMSPPRKQTSVIDKFEARMYRKGNKQPEIVPQNTSIKQLQAACREEAREYLRVASTVNGSTDALKWWRENESRYPTVQLLARKWLACVATSVPSERAFSTSGNIVTIKQSSLKPSMVEYLVLLAHNK